MAYPSRPWADRNPATPTCAAAWCTGPVPAPCSPSTSVQSHPASTPPAFFVVDDFDQTLAELRSRGLALVDYDLAHVTTQDGVCWLRRMPGGGPGFHDPDGNVLGLFEQPFLTPA